MMDRLDSLKLVNNTIGFFVRTDQATKGGGDLIQAKAYMAALQRRGKGVRLIMNAQELADIDLLHVFNLDRPWDCLPLARAARDRGCPVVLSPIAHPRESVCRYQAERSFWWERLLVGVGVGGGFSERLKAVGRAVGSRNAQLFLTALGHSISRARLELWGLADGIQLLSIAEREELAQQGLSFSRKAAMLVRNGVDSTAGEGVINSPVLAEFIRQHPRFAVVGGRIEPRKNQIEIIRAAASIGIPVIFAGQSNLRHRRYCREFEQAVRGDRRMLYAGAISRELFAGLLKAAHLHVSASLFEVSPLVDLEARAAGCRVVATRASLGVEFLDQYAELCDPWSTDSIREALARTWFTPNRAPHMAVPEWDDTATPLIDLYRQTCAT